MRLLAVTSSLFVVLLLLAAPAFGHAQLIASSPADGVTVTEPLDEVALEFNEPVEADFGQLQVRDPEGNRVDAAVPVGAGPVVRVELEDLTVAGRYTVAWRVVSADGHPIEGTFGFEVTEEALGGPETADPEPAAESTPDAARTPDPEPTPDAEPTAAATADAPAPVASPQEAADVDEDSGGSGVLVGLFVVVIGLSGGAVLLLRSGSSTDGES